MEKINNMASATDWFAVLATGGKSQAAVMTLAPGQSSGNEAEAHKRSEQILLVLEGSVRAEVEGERRTLQQGDLILIPAGARHRFTNEAGQRAITFNTYSPPEY